MTEIMDRVSDWLRGRAASVPAAERFAPSPDVVAAEREGRTVLLDMRRSRYWGLDEVGGEIWRGVEAGRAVHEIAEALADRYATSAAVIETDARALLEQLWRSGLVVRR